MIFSKNLKRHQILHAKKWTDFFFSNLLLRLISLNNIQIKIFNRYFHRIHKNVKKISALHYLRRGKRLLEVKMPINILVINKIVHSSKHIRDKFPNLVDKQSFKSALVV